MKTKTKVKRKNNWKTKTKTKAKKYIKTKITLSETITWPVKFCEYNLTWRTKVPQLVAVGFCQVADLVDHDTEREIVTSETAHRRSNTAFYS